MRRRFIIRIVLTLVALSFFFIVYLIEGHEHGYESVHVGIWQLFQVLIVFLSWAGITEIWAAGHRKQATMLSMLFGFGGINALMLVPAPAWAFMIMIVVCIYSLFGAWRYRYELKEKCMSTLARKDTS